MTQFFTLQNFSILSAKDKCLKLLKINYLAVFPIINCNEFRCSKFLYGHDIGISVGSNVGPRLEFSARKVRDKMASNCVVCRHRLARKDFMKLLHNLYFPPFS